MDRSIELFEIKSTKFELANLEGGLAFLDRLLVMGANNY